MEFPAFQIFMMLLLAGGMFYGQRVYKKKKAEWGKTFTIGCAFGIILLTIYTNLIRKPNTEGPRLINMAYERAQAIVLANQLANMYSGQGKCLVIHGPQYNEADKESVNHLVSAFKDGFQNRVTEIRAVPIRNVVPGPNGFSEEDMGEFTAEEFNKVIKDNKDCDMIVLLIKLPFSETELFEMDPFLMIEDPNNPNKWIRDPKKDYPLVGVFNGYIGNSESLFHDNLLGAMTMWRPNPVIDDKEAPEDVKEAFQKRYVVVTNQNIDEMKTKYPTLFPTEKK